MEQVLHGSARTTPAIRQLLQTSTASTASLARQYGLNEKTVRKWRNRPSTQDAPMGPKAPVSTVLTAAEAAAACLFRQHMQLGLDDCLYTLQDTIPHLTRSALHRLFKRHGISRLPEEAQPVPAEKKKFKDYPIGYFHLDFAELHTAEGKHYLFVAVDRTSKLAFAELASEATVATALAFWQRVVAAVPCKIHTVLTDNGVQFAPLPHRVTPTGHAFDRYCAAAGIEHRRTKVAHPWTNGQVERMNRTVKEATVQRYFYQSQQELNEHLQCFLAAYNGAKRLKKLRGQTPYEFICAEYEKNPSTFKFNPNHDLVGLYK